MRMTAATPASVAGLDEAGRGCLAGPVVAAAVILPHRYDTRSLADSKELSPARRTVLASEIRSGCHWGLGVIWAPVIDRINILQASLLAMCRAAACLNERPDLLLIDGNKTIPLDMLQRFWGHAAPRQRAIVDGDALEPAISAASILAKVYRDELMEHLDRRYPGYGFARHKGYGTREHLNALRQYGPCRLHRRTFRGVLEKQHQPVQGSLC